MAAVNPMNFSFHLKKDDLEPPLRIQIIDSDTDEAFDLTGYTGAFSMANKETRSTLKVNAQAVNITDAANGKAEYRWQSGDTDTVGSYIYEFKFTTAERKFTVPVVSPGVVVVESKIGS